VLPGAGLRLCRLAPREQPQHIVLAGGQCLLFLLWTLLTSVHLLRRTWRKPAPVARAQAVVGA
jgi:hypothetical protein